MEDAIQKSIASLQESFELSYIRFKHQNQNIKINNTDDIDRQADMELTYIFIKKVLDILGIKHTLARYTQEDLEIKITYKNKEIDNILISDGIDYKSYQLKWLPHCDGMPIREIIEHIFKKEMQK